MIERLKDLDVNGSGEVLYTQKNLTIIVSKLNEVIDRLNMFDLLIDDLAEMK